VRSGDADSGQRNGRQFPRDLSCAVGWKGSVRQRIGKAAFAMTDGSNRVVPGVSITGVFHDTRVVWHNDSSAAKVRRVSRVPRSARLEVGWLEVLRKVQPTALAVWKPEAQATLDIGDKEAARRRLSRRAMRQPRARYLLVSGRENATLASGAVAGVGSSPRRGSTNCHLRTPTRRSVGRIEKRRTTRR